MIEDIGSGDTFYFQEGHPGREYICLKKRKTPAIPIIYKPNDYDINLDKLHVFDEHIDYETKQLREKYALLALILFLPFREKKDLCNENESFWEAFTTSKRQYMWKKGFDILQNIQDKYNLSKIRKPKDQLHKDTKYMGDECECNDDGNENENDDIYEDLLNSLDDQPDELESIQTLNDDHLVEKCNLEILR